MKRTKKSDLIVITHTLSLCFKPDPSMSIEKQVAELKANCEAAVDYMWDQGKYTENTECEAVGFHQATTGGLVGNLQ